MKENNKEYANNNIEQLIDNSKNNNLSTQEYVEKEQYEYLKSLNKKLSLFKTKNNNDNHTVWR